MSMKNNLSAGRVQSVAVRIIAEREREINAFTSVSTFSSKPSLQPRTSPGRWCPLPRKGRNRPQRKCGRIPEVLHRGNVYRCDIQVNRAKKHLPPLYHFHPQQEASRKLGYSVSRTMLLAQKLYESGKITYMRTDSVSLSETAMEAITGQITSQYGKKYVQVRKFKNKNESAQEAHEAIRPTYMDTLSVDDSDGKRLMS